MLSDKRFWIFAGLTLSAALVALVFARLDWERFLRVFSEVNVVLIMLAVLPLSASIALRSVRWRLIARERSGKCGRFWAATVLGYLGNYIYPMRAGEIIRVIALNRLAGTAVGRGAASAALDRIADVILLGCLVLAVIAIHSGDVFGPAGLARIVGLILLPILALLLFGVYGNRLHGLVERLSLRLPVALGGRIPEWYVQSLDLVRSYRQVRSTAPVAVITVMAFAVDVLTIWTLLFAFGWSLPISAAITLEVFLSASSALPSAPGYIGVYQVASVLALKLYDIDASGAVALSLVIQMSLFIVVIVKTLWVCYRYKIRPASAITTVPTAENTRVK